MLHCNRGLADCKSIDQNSTPPRHLRLPLTPTEKARRVADLRRMLHAPTFQTRIVAGEWRDRP